MMPGSKVFTYGKLACQWANARNADVYWSCRLMDTMSTNRQKIKICIFYKKRVKSLCILLEKGGDTFDRSGF